MRERVQAAARATSAACLTVFSAPRTAPISRSQFRRSGAGEAR